MYKTSQFAGTFVGLFALFLRFLALFSFGFGFGVYSWRVLVCGGDGENQTSTSHEHNARRFLQQSPLLALSSNILLPLHAPDLLRDIATYFFFEKIFRSDMRICMRWLRVRKP